MKACLLLITVAAFPMLGTTNGEHPQSKLAGSWVLVEGVTEFAGHQKPLTDKGQVYLVIRPDGRFYQTANLRHAFLDDLRNKGDKYVTSKCALEVDQAVYEPGRSQLVLVHDTGYHLTSEATLLSNGRVSYHSTVPSYGGATLTVTATLEKVEGARPWIESDDLLATWKVEDGTPFAVDISANGRLVVAADLSGRSVYLWDVQQSDPLRIFKGHTNDVSAVAVSHDGRYVASGSRVSSGRTTEDESLRIWDASTGEQTQQIEAFSTVNSIEFLLTDKSLLVAGVPSHAFGNTTAGIWDVETAQRQANFLNFHHVRTARCLRDGTSVLCVRSNNATGDPVGLYDMASGNEIRQIASTLDAVDAIAVSPDGKRMLTCSQEPFVREWGIQSGNEIRRIHVDRTWATKIVYLPDGRRMITAGRYDHALSIWDLETGDQIKKWVGHRDHIRDMKISEDGRTMVTCSDDGTVKLWRIPA